MPEQVTTPHFDYPFNYVNGDFAVVEQGSPAELENCVEVILSCPLGFREELPEFGLADQAFKEGGADLEGIEDAISKWEPRVDEELEENFDKKELISTVVINLKRRNISG